MVTAPGLQTSFEVFAHHWGWYVAMGTFLVAAGGLAIASPVLSTVMAVFMFGWLLVACGIVQLIGAIGSRRWDGFLLSLLSGVLSLVIGIMTFRQPGMMDLALTMLIATLLLAGGVFRVIVASLLRFHGRDWAGLGGLLSALLGGYIFATLPISSIWVLGSFLGVDLLVTGWTWLYLGSAARVHDEQTHAASVRAGSAADGGPATKA